MIKYLLSDDAQWVVAMVAFAVIMSPGIIVTWVALRDRSTTSRNHP